TAWLTAPPGLSRPPTSFIGSWCQGIHTSALTHLTTQQRCSHPLYNSQPTTPTTTTSHPQQTTRGGQGKQRTHTTPTPRPHPPPTPTHAHARQRVGSRPWPAKGRRACSLITRQGTPASTKTQPLADATHGACNRLPRKEVIQPHLPVRLP